jgi:LysM repeat protein
MRKTFKRVCIIVLVLVFFSVPQITLAECLNHIPAYSSADELISAVNALRATYGLAPYQPNSILMGIAQAHAEYLLSIGTFTHISGDGLRPFQRALAAGYLVAGDLSLGGFFAENVTGGINQTADEAVQAWMGDDPHKNTMLSGTMQDVGAGVAVSGNTYYYVLDAGLSTGGTPVAYTPPAPLYPSTPSIVPNTPNSDGSIMHIVQPGETLGSIRLAYQVPLADILKLNNLTLNSTIYPNQKIIIRAAFTPTATRPTSTPTTHPTITPRPTSSPTSTITPIPATPTRSPGLPVSTAGPAVIAIVASALLLAGLITILGRTRK